MLINVQASCRLNACGYFVLSQYRQTFILYLLPAGTVTEGGSAVEANFVEFPNSEKIADLAMAATYVVAVSENGNIYYWGKNSVWYY